MNRRKRLTYKVSFRLEEKHGQMLEERAVTSNTTAHDIARKLVEEKLNRNDEALLDGLNYLGQMVSELHEAFTKRVNELAAKQTEQSDELSKLKASLGRDLKKLVEAIQR